MIVTLRVDVLVAGLVRKESPFIGEGVLLCARTYGYLRREVFQVTVVHEPSVAKSFLPFCTVLPLPLPIKVPAQWNWSTPQHSTKKNCTRYNLQFNKSRNGESEGQFKKVIGT